MDTTNNKTNRYSGLWAIPIACLFSLLLTNIFPFFNVTDRWLNDLQVSFLNPSVEKADEIVVLTISDKDLEQFPYRSPVDRAYLTDILAVLKQRDIKALFMDIIFDQPTEPEKDKALKDAIDNFGKPVVISYGTAGAGLNENQLAYQAEFVTPDKRGLPNLVKSGQDQTARWFFPGQEVKGQGYIKSVPNLLAEYAEGIAGPTEEVAIRWYGNKKHDGVPFKVFSAKNLKLMPPNWFKDKVVFLGFDLSLHDRHSTAFSVVLGDKGRMPGLFILGHIYMQVLNTHSYYSGTVENIINAIGIILAAAVAVIPSLFISGRLAWRMLAFGVLFIGVFFFIYAAYQYLAIYMSFSKTSLAFAFSVLFMELWRRRQEEKQKKFVHDAFGMFVDKEYVDILIDDPSKISLTGDRKHMSYIFTDIAGFTTFSEKNDAIVVSESLNDYLSECSDVIFANKGTIVDFIGDAIFVVFNAPIDQDNYEQKAVQCALGLAAKSKEFMMRPEMQEIGFGSTRVGVHCGISIIGNMGSKDRMKFSALGDTINTTARLEGLNKYLGTTVMMSEDIAHCHDHKRLLGRFILKGKIESLGVYEPLDDTHPAAAYLEDYDKAYALMEKGDTGALDAFKALSSNHPDDTVLAFHLKRLEAGSKDDIVKMDDK